MSNIINSDPSNLTLELENELDTSWINAYDKEEEQYQLFYKSPNTMLTLSILYINADSELENIKTKRIRLLKPNQISKEEFIYILKKHDRLDDNKYTLRNILLYNIDIGHDDVNGVMSTLNTDNKNIFLNNLINLETYNFNSSINFFQEMNTLYLLLTEDKKKGNHNYTKRVHFNCSQKETKRKTRRLR
tara:strand:+ start:1187 stop:1753 length:567 start_codon:yes stop_codon:yes gene_type:complete